MKSKPIRAESLWSIARSRGMPAGSVLLDVRVAEQRLMVWSGGRIRGSYRISTARNGVGAKEGSHRTPPGWHAVASSIGAGLRRGSVFISRRFTGEVLPRSQWRSPDGMDRILTRILRLRGLESGVNRGPGVDSYQRFIYVHGTNQEQHLGRPASHGCIRLGNDDMLDLFRRVHGRTTWCWIG